VKAFFAMLAAINQSMMTLRQVLASNPAVNTATRECEVRRYGDGMTEGERYDFETYVETTTHAGETFTWWLGVTLRSSGWTLERSIEKQVEDRQDSVRKFDDATFSNSSGLTDRYSTLVSEFVESANNFDFNI
jgi:hypothetical protein